MKNATLYEMLDNIENKLNTKSNSRISESKYTSDLKFFKETTQKVYESKLLNENFPSANFDKYASSNLSRPVTSLTSGITTDPEIRKLIQREMEPYIFNAKNELKLIIENFVKDLSSYKYIQSDISLVKESVQENKKTMLIFQEDLEKRFNDYANKFHIVNKQFDDVKSNFTDFTKRMKNFEKMYASLEEKEFFVRNIKDKIDTIEINNAKIFETMENNNNLQFSGKFKNIENSLDSLKRENKNVNETLTDLNNYCNNLNNQTKDLTVSNNNFNSELKDLNEKHNAINLNCKSLNNNCENLSNGVTAINEKFFTIEKNHQKVQEQVDVIDNDLNNLYDKLNSTETSHKETKAKVDQVSSTQNSLKNEITNITSNNKAVNEKLTKLDDKITKNLDSLQFSLNEKMIECNENMTSQNEKSNEKITKLNNQVFIINSSLNEMNLNLNSYRTNLNTLSQSMQDKQDKNNSNSNANANSNEQVKVNEIFEKSLSELVKQMLNMSDEIAQLKIDTNEHDENFGAVQENFDKLYEKLKEIENNIIVPVVSEVPEVEEVKEVPVMPIKHEENISNNIDINYNSEEIEKLQQNIISILNSNALNEEKIEKLEKNILSVINSNTQNSEKTERLEKNIISGLNSNAQNSEKTDKLEQNILSVINSNTQNSEKTERLEKNILSVINSNTQNSEKTDKLQQNILSVINSNAQNSEKIEKLEKNILSVLNSNVQNSEKTDKLAQNILSISDSNAQNSEKIEKLEQKMLSTNMPDSIKTDKPDKDILSINDSNVLNEEKIKEFEKTITIINQIIKTLTSESESFKQDVESQFTESDEWKDNMLELLQKSHTELDEKLKLINMQISVLESEAESQKKNKAIQNSIPIEIPNSNLNEEKLTMIENKLKEMSMDKNGSTLLKSEINTINQKLSENDEKIGKIFHYFDPKIEEILECINTICSKLDLNVVLNKDIAVNSNPNPNNQTNSNILSNIDSQVASLNIIPGWPSGYVSNFLPNSIFALKAKSASKSTSEERLEFTDKANSAIETHPSKKNKIKVREYNPLLSEKFQKNLLYLSTNPMNYNEIKSELDGYLDKDLVCQRQYINVIEVEMEMAMQTEVNENLLSYSSDNKMMNEREKNNNKENEDLQAIEFNDDVFCSEELDDFDDDEIQDMMYQNEDK